MAAKNVKMLLIKETEKDKSERIAETSKAAAQVIEMAMWYTLVDRTRCFSGQRMA